MATLTGYYYVFESSFNVDNIMSNYYVEQQLYSSSGLVYQRLFIQESILLDALLNIRRYSNLYRNQLPLE